MDPTFVLGGRLQRDYLLPAEGRPLLDVPGGNLLHAAAGLSVWNEGQPRRVPEPGRHHKLRDCRVGLLSRVGEDYPQEWLKSFEERGWDRRGIHILAEALDLRHFQANLPRPVQDPVSLAAAGTTAPPEPGSGLRFVSSADLISRTNPVAHFARLGLPYPKSLLGYQPPEETGKDRKDSEAASPRPGDIPPDYLTARAVHLCPLDYLTASRLSSTFRQASVTTLTLDPTAACMTGRAFEDMRILLQGVTAFLPSEEEVRALFWGRTNDLWEMAEALGAFGCEFIVIKSGARGQRLYDSVSRKRWEIPAYPARLVDGTGAGDSFSGGFLAGYQKTYDPLRGVLHGSVSASLTIEGSGCFHALEALPGLAERRLESLAGLVREI